MRHKVTKRTEALVEELQSLLAETQSWLRLASAAAQGEWHGLKSRAPTRADLSQGFLTIPEQELEEMCSKLKRFRTVVSAPVWFMPPPPISDRFADSLATH